MDSKYVSPKGEIRFYDTKLKNNGAFSNFYPLKVPMTIPESNNGLDGNTEYYSSEAYFQAEKFKGDTSTYEDRKYADLIGSQKTAGKSTYLARQKVGKVNYPWAQDLKPVIEESH